MENQLGPPRLQTSPVHSATRLEFLKRLGGVIPSLQNFLGFLSHTTGDLAGGP